MGARRLFLESLEPRTMLNATLAFQHIVFDPGGGAAGAADPGGAATSSLTPLGSSSSPPSGAFTPSQIRTAYGIGSIQLGSLVGDGAGQTIAIIDAYDDPNILTDLQTFSAQFALPAFNGAEEPTFQKLDENGGTNYPAVAGTSGWALEESLDVEWAHAVAPMANLVLIETVGPNGGDMLSTAVNTAWNLPGVSVVSMSFGEGEWSSETSSDGAFTTPTGHEGVTFVASTGDSGSPGEYPAASPNVLAVGGTSLKLNPDNTYQSEAGWSGSGGGQSPYEAEPGYQPWVQNPNSGWRQSPDVAFDANPNTGVAVLDSYDYGSTPWIQVGGTSLSAPCWAGLIAIADQLRVSKGLGTLDGSSQTLPKLAALTAADFHDVVGGSNGGYSAVAGYDMVTGRGTPVANQLVVDLTQATVATVSTTAAANSYDAVGASIPITVTFSDAVYVSGAPQLALNAGTGAVASYTGGSGTDALTFTYTVATSQSTPDLDYASQAALGLNGGTIQDSADSPALLGLPPTGTNSLATTLVHINEPVATLTNLAGSVASMVYGQAVTLTAAVTTNPLDIATPTGTVDFVDATTQADLGRASLSSAGVASLSVSALPAGSQNIVACYQGNSGFLASNSPLAGSHPLLTTAAGEGAAGYTGDAGPAIAAELSNPTGVAADAAGNLFIADAGDNCVREVIRSTGLIVTVAGNGRSGYSGDNGAATLAELNAPWGVAVDAAGNLFIADTGNNCIREVSSGTITTVAGIGGSGRHDSGYSGDGGLATLAKLRGPQGVAVDANGNIFIADTGNNRVREVVHASGHIATFAGTGTGGYNGDNIHATSAWLHSPYGVAVNAAGDVFIADYYNQRIREVSPAGMITTMAGTGLAGYAGDGGPATSARLFNPEGVAVDAAGDIFIADYGNNRVREVAYGTGTIATVAGNGTAGYSGDGGPATSGELDAPVGVAVGASGSVFIADSLNAVVRQIFGAVQIAVGQATPAVNVADDGGAYDGQPFPAAATVAGVVSGVDTAPAATLEGIAPTLAYYAGTTVSGTPTATPPTSVGMYTVVASFAGSSDYAAQSASATFTIAQTAPTLAVTDAGGTYNGQPFAATATLAGAGGGLNPVVSLEGDAPTLTYYPGTSPSGSGSATPPTTAGTYTVVAVFAGTADYAPETSSVTFTIAQAPTSTTLTTLAPDQALTLTASVAAANPASGVPTGTVTFEDDGTALPGQSTVPLSDGTASFTISTLTAGGHAVTAVYTGDTNYTNGAAAAEFSVLPSQTGQGAGVPATVSIVLDASNAAQADVLVPAAGSTPAYTVAIADFSQWYVLGDGTGGQLTVDFSNGNPLPAGGLVFNGDGVPSGEGSGDGLRIVGTSGNDNVILTPSRITVGAATIAYANVSSMSFAGAAGLNISGGTVVLAAANQYTGPTTVSDGTLVVSNSQALPPGGTLNIGADASVMLGDSTIGGVQPSVLAAPAPAVAAAPLVSGGPTVASTGDVAVSPAVGDSGAATTSASAAPAQPAITAASTPAAAQPDVQVRRAVSLAVAAMPGPAAAVEAPVAQPVFDARQTIADWHAGATGQSWLSTVGPSTADTAGSRGYAVAGRPPVMQKAPTPAADSGTSSRATDEALLDTLPTLPRPLATFSDGYDPLAGLFGLDPLTLDLLARAQANRMGKVQSAG